MKRTIRIWVALILLLMALPAPLAQAHNGPPRIELGAERVAPGVALEVRGVNIAPEQPVTLALVGGGKEFSFGVVLGNEHGDFTQIVTVPREALAGAYSVRAIGPVRLILAAPLTIVGTADEEGGEQRGEEEPLLAPMPRPQAAVQSGAPAPGAAQGSSLAPWLVAALVALAAVAALTIVVRRRPARAIE